MVILIGLVTMGALVGLLVWSLAGESHAERRRSVEMTGRSGSGAMAELGASLKRAA